MQYTTHYSGRLGRALSTLAIAATLFFLAVPASAFAGRVFIDPGHGGRYSGATYSGVREADINLSISLELDRLLRDRGHATAMSRRTDVDMAARDIPTWRYENGAWTYSPDGAPGLSDDLQTRCDLANRWGADIFVSIHANGSTSSSTTGAETWWYDMSATDRVLSQRLASYVQQEYIAETGLNDRGLKDGVAFYVLRWSNMPAIIVETGFMSNSGDLSKLVDPRFQQRAARAIARGIDRFLADDPFTPLYPRLSGTDRYATTVSIADAGWSTKTGGTVILASGTSWPDALTGTPLSRPMDAPMLLTQPDVLPAATRDRIAAQAPARIVVLGGINSIGERVVAEAVAATGREPDSVIIDRISGSNRFETAEAIARRVRVPSSGRVIVASGRTYADALSIAPFAGSGRMPILLVEEDRVPEATRRFIADNAALITEFEIVGGELAVGPAVVSELRETARVIRTAGSSRYTTNTAVIARYRPTGTLDPMIATGRAYPDALTAGALASRTSRPVLLVDGSRHLPATTREFLLNNRDRIADPTIVGGRLALSHQMEWMIQKGLAR